MVFCYLIIVICFNKCYYLFHKIKIKIKTERRGQKMNALGIQLVVEMYRCNRATLNNRDMIEKFMLQAVEVSGATIIQPFFHLFSPYGVSGVVVIAESHVAIHTWPEYGYAAVDVFTCGETINPQVIVDHLRERLEAEEMSVQEIKRGVLNLPGDNIRHKPDA